MGNLGEALREELNCESAYPIGHLKCFRCRNLEYPYGIEEEARSLYP